MDDDSGLEGPAFAQFLNMPQVTLITKAEFSDGKVKCTRPVEGQTLVIEADLPVVLTAQRGLNEPRYASLPGIMKAKKKPLDTKTLADLGLERDDKLQVVSLTPPPARAAGKVIEGDTPAELAANLVKALHEEAKVI